MAANSESLSGKRTFIIAIISAVLGSTGGPYILGSLFGLNPYRADPYTGTQGKILERRVEAIEFHVRNHPDEVNKFDRRITVLETQNEVIIANQQRILARLEK